MDKKERQEIERQRRETALKLFSIAIFFYVIQSHSSFLAIFIGF